MSEHHVASFIARTHSILIKQVQEGLSAISGCEVHAVDPCGKLILTLEGDSHKQISQLYEDAAQVQGLIDITPVYHEYFDTAEDNSVVKAS